MPSIINADDGAVSGSMGLKQSADTTGNLVLQSNGNAVISIDTSLNANFAGTMSAVGNVTGGNILTAGLMSSTGNAVHGNILTAGIMSSTGNAVHGNILTAGLISATGNVTVASNLIAGNSRVTVQNTGVVLKPYTPAFFATGNSGSITVVVGNYFPFNSLNTAFAGSNRNGGYNTSTYLYTAPVAGLYYFYAQFYFQGGGSISWWKNGVQQSYQDVALAAYYSYPSSVAQINGGSVTLELAANDTVGLQPRTGSGNIAVYMGHSSFLGYLIG